MAILSYQLDSLLSMKNSIFEETLQMKRSGRRREKLLSSTILISSKGKRRNFMETCSSI